MIEITREPGRVKLLQATGSDNTIACAGLVHEEFDEVTQPVIRHHKIEEEMVMKGHWGCLDHCYVTFRVETPIQVARQILRASNHSFNEKSLRYLKAVPVFYVPEVFYTDVKRKELGNEPEALTDDLQGFAYNAMLHSFESSWANYGYLTSIGARKEQARGVLPFNVYTSFWMSAPLSDVLHFLNLRTDSHSQLETQYIANKMLELITPVYPKTIENWKKYAKGPINEYGTIQTA